MKYFTKALLRGELDIDNSDDESEDAWIGVCDAYQAYIKTIAPRLPKHLSELANDVNLHDGLIRRVLVEQSEACLTIELRCGDLQAGYFDLDLLYSGVDMDSLDVSVLKGLAEDPSTNLLYDEIDLESDDIYVHRIISWIDGKVFGSEILGGMNREFEVRFREFEMRRRPRPDYEIDPLGYEESGTDTA